MTIKLKFTVIYIYIGNSLDKIVGFKKKLDPFRIIFVGIHNVKVKYGERTMVLGGHRKRYDKRL